MNNRKFGPYRATALWNEAVVIFRDGMMLSEHRHRLHKHKNSFTGRSAVTFLHGALKSSDLFNSDITREQVCQLLNQFLNANLIQPASNCSVTTQKKFVDSYKYFYEFTDELEHFQPKLPFQYIMKNHVGCSKLDHDVIDQKSSKDDFNLSYCHPKTVEELWKEALIKRIIDLLRPLDVEYLIPAAEINPKWVYANASPNYFHLQSNTELPHWVLGAMNKLLQWSSRDTCTATYKDFEIDVFNVVHEYFNTLVSPLISSQFYQLYSYVFLYIDYLNSFESIIPKSQLSRSTENLVLNISSPLKGKHTYSEESRKHVDINMTYLSPDSCLETVFTSDDPITRIVPKCSVESSPQVQLSVMNDIIMYNSSFKLNANKENENEVCRLRSRQPRQALKSVENIQFGHFKKSSTENDYRGIVNKAFALSLTPQKQATTTVHNSQIQKKEVGFENSAKTKIKMVHQKFPKSLNFTIQGFVNRGLSSSSESIDADVNVQRIDYQSAYESLKKLMLVSLSGSKSTCSSDDEISSYYTAASSSSSYSSSNCSNSSCSTLSCISGPDSLFDWSQNLLQLGVSVFQLLFMMLPPCNRARLRYLLLLMRSLPEATTSSYFSLQNLVLKMSRIIIRPADGIYFDEFFTRRVITFFVIHYDFMFEQLQPDFLESIKLYVMQNQSKSTKSFCEQISTEQFEKQRCESEAALHELLDHILDDKKMKSKEKKKKLKMFEEAYPNIYKCHFFKIRGNKPVSLHRLTKLPG